MFSWDDCITRNRKTLYSTSVLRIVTQGGNPQKRGASATGTAERGTGLMQLAPPAARGSFRIGVDTKDFAFRPLGEVVGLVRCRAHGPPVTRLDNHDYNTLVLQDTIRLHVHPPPRYPPPHAAPPHSYDHSAADSAP